MFGLDLHLMGFIGICICAALTGALFKPGPWYAQLDKPRWTPPNWLFPVVWTVLYGTIAAAGWMVWIAAAPGQAAWPLTLWLVQLIANAAWSPVFFGLRRPAWGMVVVGLMWVTIAGTIVLFWRVDHWAALLMVPYLVWVTIAAALNLSIWRRNPQDAGWGLQWAR